VEQLAAIWANVTAVQPPLEAWVVALVILGAAAVVVSPLWLLARHGITIVHEAGHGFVATLTGRRLAGIRLHSDTSGVTVSVGRPRGPGMAFTLLAGYPAAALVGLGAAWLISTGHATGMLWALLGIVVLVLIQIRNWFGLWSVAVAGALVVAATMLLDGYWQSVVATGLTALLLIGALRTSVELQITRRREDAGRGRGNSDADQLARLTGVPAIVWVGVFVITALTCVAAGAVLLLRLDASILLAV